MMPSMKSSKRSVLKVQYTTQTPQRWHASENSGGLGRTWQNAYKEKRKALANHIRKVRKDPLSRKALRSEVKNYKLL